ncbi:MAG: hypothetical protein HC799_15540 [Limnothrix sp. RL_2_0]|nr:hypothetical protein [Limnothrix sp. RL_2_0]
MNFATDLPPLIDDLERVTQLSDVDNLEELQQHLLQQQEVLLKVKDYLVYLHAEGATGNRSSDLLSVQTGDAGAIAAAVIQELQLKRTEWVAPISQELDQLSAQKQILEREIYRLNQQYENVLEHFPQQLLSYFQGLLQTQLSKSVELFEQRLRYISSITHPVQGLEDAGFAASEAQIDPTRTPMEHAQAVQQNLDQSLTNLDNTIQSVFGALEKDIASYQLSLTDDLRRLHGLQPTNELPPEVDLSPVEISLPNKLEAIAPPAPEVPELQSILDVETTPDEVLPTEPPEVLSLFGDEDYYGEPAALDQEDSETASSELTTPDFESTEAEEPEVSVQDQYLDFAASVTEDSLFGDAPDTEKDSSESAVDGNAEDIPAVSFLFGDPIETPEPEETKTSDLQNLVAFPTTETTADSEQAPESTTVKTIQLLSDLLENGHLNVQENETETEPEDDTMEMLDAAGNVPMEDLNLEPEEEEEEVLKVTVLDPEKMDQLADDLTSFEMSTTSEQSEEQKAEAETIDVASTESGSVDDLWGG